MFLYLLFWFIAAIIYYYVVYDKVLTEEENKAFATFFGFFWFVSLPALLVYGLLGLVTRGRK